MNILLQKAGKHFNKRWILKNIDLELKIGDSLALLGENGSGKSTLLKILSGQLSLDEGKIEFRIDSKIIEAADVYHHVAISAPYLELIEEMSLHEFLEFHFSFKKAILSVSEIIDLLGLQAHSNQRLDSFSSGMKQRVNLAQALFTKSQILLLDEPYSNLDEKGKLLFDSLIPKYSEGRILIVASNNEREYRMCAQQLDVQTP